MIWGVIGLAVASLALAGVAVALGIRAGNLKYTSDAFELERDVALAALKVRAKREADLELVIKSRNRELQSLYEEIETCGDDDSRARAAIAGIKLLLPPKVDEDADTDPS